MVVADVHKDAADEAVNRLVAKGWKATSVVVNVSDASQVQKMVDMAVSTYGSIDILVNNAGIYPNIPVMQISEEEFSQIISINLKGVFLATKAVATQMIAPGTGSENMTKEMEAQIQPFLDKIPMKRMAEPDEIGKVALFLASDLSSYMTGSQIVVDGGVLLS